MYKVYLNIRCSLGLVRIQFISSSSIHFILSQIMDIVSNFSDVDVERSFGTIVNSISNEALNFKVNLNQRTVIFDFS